MIWLGPALEYALRYRSWVRSIVAATLVIMTACAQPAPPPPETTTVDTAAVAADLRESTVAALSLLRFASIVGVFFEATDDLHTEEPPADAAILHATHARGVLADCPTAVVTHDAGATEVVVEFGIDCVVANTGAHVEGTLFLSVLEDAPRLLLSGRLNRLTLHRVVVDGLALTGTIDQGVAGIVTAGDVGPFVVAALGSTIERDGPSVTVSIATGNFLVPPPGGVSDDCVAQGRSFEVKSLAGDPTTCAAIAGVLTERRNFACPAVDAVDAQRIVRVETIVPLDAGGTVAVGVSVDGADAEVHEFEMPELPVGPRCGPL